jgi:carbamoyl-phosphate synthase large subunit
MALSESGALEKYGVELIGATAKAIALAEDRRQFSEAMHRIGLAVAAGGIAESYDEAEAILETTGFPAIIRPSYTLGGTGGGIAYNREEFEEIVRHGLDQSPTHQVLVERSVIGWKEFELEVMRDHDDNVVIVCSIENIDPMGVHTGDSITIAPAMTLTDREYQSMRDAAVAIIREVGVDAGGCNIQFAINPRDGEMLVIEMNPRVSRSSALASKATGFPIARIGAKLAVGYRLDEIANDITKTTPASFEPVLDYVVVKVPRFAFEKFPSASPYLTTQMKSVGESMAIGRTFKEAFQKGLRALETGRSGWTTAARPIDDRLPDESEEALHGALRQPTPERIFQVKRALERGLSVAEVYDLTAIDPWFLNQMLELIEAEREYAALDAVGADDLRSMKRMGFSDRQLGALRGESEDAVRE